jgi:hypothetical protein
MSNMDGWTDYSLKQPDCDQYLAYMSEVICGSRFQVVSRLKISNGHLVICAGHLLSDQGVDILYWKPMYDITNGLLNSIE